MQRTLSRLYYKSVTAQVGSIMSAMGTTTLMSLAEFEVSKAG